MSDQKINIPDEVLQRARSQGSSAMPESKGGEINTNNSGWSDAGAKVEVARLQVAKEGIQAVKGFFDVIKSANQLKATREEWQGRIAEAEIAVTQAEVNLQAAREKNQLQKEELEHSREVLSRILGLFDYTMDQLNDPDSPAADSKEARDYLLQLSEQMVKLKK